jgi:hypothetical protein
MPTSRVPLSWERERDGRNDEIARLKGKVGEMTPDDEGKTLL